jgi:four helix bundle protein
LKEAKESQYWIKLLIHSDYISKELGTALISDLEEIIAMLTSSIKTSKLKLTP